MPSCCYMMVPQLHSDASCSVDSLADQVASMRGVVQRASMIQGRTTSAFEWCLCCLIANASLGVVCG